MEAPFIDIHTHKTGTVPDGIAEVRNILVNELPGSGLNDAALYSAGIHPWYASAEKLQDELKLLEKLIARPNIIAIGEAGLDRAVNVPFEFQKQVFESQLLLAAETRMPVIVHAVRSYPDIVEVYKKAGSDITLIFHGFSGNIQIAQQLTDHGFFLSFGKSLLGSNAKIQEAFRSIPLENIFLETDESKLSIEEIYQRAAELKGVSIGELKEIIFHSFNQLFSR